MLVCGNLIQLASDSSKVPPPPSPSPSPSPSPPSPPPQIDPLFISKRVLRMYQPSRVPRLQVYARRFIVPAFQLRHRKEERREKQQTPCSGLFFRSAADGGIDSARKKRRDTKSRHGLSFPMTCNRNLNPLPPFYPEY